MVESREAHFEKRITDALVEVGILAAEQLERCRQVSQSEGSDLLETLVTSGMVARGIVITMMGLQLRVPVEDLHNSNISFEAVSLLPQEVAREHRVLPLALEADGSLRIAVSQIHERQLISRLSSITGRRIRVVLTLGRELEQLIDRVFESIADNPKPEPIVFPEPPVFYEGTANVRTQYTANLLLIVDFVQQLRDTPQLRLLRLVSQSTNEVDILLGLREPLDLKDLLEGLSGVTKVTVTATTQPGDGGPLLLVQLAE